MSRFLSLLWWTSKGYRLQLLQAAMAAMLVAAATTSLCTLGQAAREAVVEALIGGGGRLRARPGTIALGPIDLSGMLGERRMDARSLAELEAVDGVAQVWPEAWSRAPVQLEGRLLGQRVWSEGALLGVVPEAVEEDANRPWTWKPGTPIPVLAPRTLLTVYNSSFAPSNGLPKLTDSAVVGLSFDIKAGRSSFSRKGPVTTAPAEVVGVTSYGGALAGIVPLEVIAWLDEEMGVDDPGSYASALLTLSPDADVDTVAADVRRLGWSTEELGGAARQLALAMETIEVGVGIAGGALVLVTLLLLAQLAGVLLRQRASDVAVLRVVGLHPLAILAMLGLEVVGVAALATVVGSALGGLGALAAAPWLGEVLGAFLGSAPTLQVRPPLWLTIPLMVGAPAIAGLFALPAMIRVVSRDPTRGD